MQVSLSIENLPIQERMSLVRQIWDSIVADAQKNSSENHFNKQELQQLLNELPDIPNEATERQHTQTIPQAVEAIERMSAVRQQEVFNFIDFVSFRHELSKLNQDSDTNSVITPIEE